LRSALASSLAPDSVALEPRVSSEGAVAARSLCAPTGSTLGCRSVAVRTVTSSGMIFTERRPARKNKLALAAPMRSAAGIRLRRGSSPTVHCLAAGVSEVCTGRGLLPEFSINAMKAIIAARNPAIIISPTALMDVLRSFSGMTPPISFARSLSSH